jgi:hypothetical protein
MERICLATGLGGKLKEHFCDEEVFLAIWLGPYLALDSASCLVAEKEGKITGYLVATYDDRFVVKAARWLLPSVLKMLGRWALGRYRSHPPTGRFIRWLLLRSWRENPRTPKPSASFHFNIDGEEKDGYPGFKLGRAFIEEARRRGKPQWHAVVFAGNGRRTRADYERMGFSIFDYRPCSLFEASDSEIATITRPLREESTGKMD